MNSALVFLLTRSVRGRIIRAIRLLKQPKYLLGIVAFVGWMGFWVVGPLLFGGDGGNVEIDFVNAEVLYQLMGDAIPAIHMLVALVFCLLVTLWWLVPWGSTALNLSEAEIHMLTPMPVRRRHLIQYATLKGQPGVLFGCLMMTVFMGSGGPLARLRWFVTFWLILSIWDMHSKGRSLWLSRQSELPPARAWRRRVTLVVFLFVYWMVVGGVVTALVAELITLRPAAGQETFEFVQQTLARYAPDVRDGILGWALLPFLWLTAPLFAAVPGSSLTQQLAALPIPLLILVVHNEWVVRSQAQFEEAALAHARREANKKAGGRRYWKRSSRSRRRTSFSLSPIGSPELAILWKNSMMVTRIPYRSLAILGVAVVLLAAVLPTLLRAHQAFFIVPLVIGFSSMAFAPFVASQNYRNDLRADLLRVEMIRPWPIEGWKLFAAEAAAPALFAIFTSLFGAALALAVDMAWRFNREILGAVPSANIRIGPAGAAEALGVAQPLLLPLVILGALPLIVALTCLSTTLQNLAVLLFPGWVQLGAKQHQGAAAFGQNMVAFLALMIASLLCLVPAAVIVGVIVLVQMFLLDLPINAWELPVLGLIAATPVMAVAGLIVRAGGRVWDKLDPSREILEGAA